MTRVLVAVDLLMYREVIAHAVREHRPHELVRLKNEGDGHAGMEVGKI